MKNAAERLASKCQADNALDTADKNREKVRKLQTFDLSYFNTKKDFDNNGSQNYLVFHPLFKSFETLTGNERILLWKSKSFSEENIKLSVTSDISLAL